MASRTHKSKSSITDQKQKRLLRVHRRSLDQREMRQQGVNKKRQIEDMSPLVESENSSKQPSKTTTPIVQKDQVAAMSRLERLKKWKQERELKRKLEAMEKAKSKPGFKVAQVKYHDVILYHKDQTKTSQQAKKQAKAVHVEPASLPSSTVPAKAKTTTSKKPTVQMSVEPLKKDSTGSRQTRSKTAAVVAKPVQRPLKSKQPSPKRAARSNFMAPTAASKIRAATNGKKGPSQSSGKQKTVSRPIPEKKDAGKVSTHRGDPLPSAEPSFAPSDFTFEAPGNIASFVFKPLSPASATNFLFPRGSGNSTTLLDFNDRVDRVSTPKGDTRPPSLSSKDSAPSSSDSEPGQEKPEKNGAKCSKSAMSPKTNSAVVKSKSDSGIEVISTGTYEEISKTVTQKSPALCTTTSMEDDEVFCQNEASVKEEPARRSKRKAATPVATEVAVDGSLQGQGQPADKDTDSATPHTASKRSKRRQTRRSEAQSVSVEDAEDGEEKTPAKRSRRSTRRSTRSKADLIGVEKEGQAVSESTSSDLVKEGAVQTTPRRAHRFSAVETMSPVREMTAATEVDESEEKAPTNGEEERCSQLPKHSDADETTESVPTETDVEKEESNKQSPSISGKTPKRRQSSRTDPKQEVTENGEESASITEKPDANAFRETAGDIPAEIELAQVKTPERSQRSLRSQQRAKDDLFLTPGPPVSAKLSTAKRRRTATMVALSKAKSPEEAIKIISTSPMIEMSRRTPKSKTPSGSRNLGSLSDEGEEPMVMEPLQLLPVFDASSTETDAAPAQASEEPKVDEKRDVTPFRTCLSTEIEKLTRLADEWTAINKSTKSLPDEVEGQIRTMVSKAHLLMGAKGKFQQFAGLVDKCAGGDPATTCQDLQGFWDMIFIQAEDIYHKFSELERLKENQWQPPVKEVVPAQPAKKVAKKVGAGKKSKPAVQSKFAAFKAQMLKQKQDKGASQDTVPEMKKFDAGFFAVSSPVRSPQYHCEAGTPNKRKSTDECEKKEQSSSSSSTATTPAKPTAATAVTVDHNKENVAQILLRRSLSVRRRSQTPTVQSPLLQDGGSAERPSVSPPKSPSKTAGDGRCPEESSSQPAATLVDTPVRPRLSTPRRRSVRRSLRKSLGRKSVGLAEAGTITEENGKGKEEEVDLTAYFQPSTPGRPLVPLEESIIDNSPLSVEDLLKHSGKMTPAVLITSDVSSQLKGEEQKSALKVLPSKERRQSRRSVSFALSPSKQNAGCGVTLPTTPYSRNLPGKRRSRSIAGTSSSMSVQEELNELSDTPRARRSARPSLLYTPPPVGDAKARAPAKDVAVAKLISFSP